MTSDPEMLREYRRYNRLLFGRSLRDDVILYWDAIYDDKEPDRPLDGELSDEIIPGKFVLRINTAFYGWKNQWRIVLVHEMAHLHLWPYEKHGDAWDREMVRLSKYKSFRKLI